MSQTLGRLTSTEGVPHDNPSATVAAILTKQDQIIDMLKALTAKLDADGGVTDADYATLTDSLKKVDLII